MSRILSLALLVATVAAGPARAAETVRLAGRPTVERDVVAALDRFASTFAEAPGANRTFAIVGHDLAVRYGPGGVDYVTGAGALRETFVAARTGVAPRPAEPVAGVTNRLHGRRATWSTGLARYASLTYDDLWRGIDLTYRAAPGRVKYEFEVEPGADPRSVVLRFSGADAARVDETGRLVLTFAGGDLVDDAPYAYQIDAGVARAVACRFAVHAPPAPGDVLVDFELGAYDATRPLVIDPAMVLGSGFFGGTMQDGIADVAVDASGALYVVGSTASAPADAFPVANGRDSTFNPTGFCTPGGFSVYDAFVAKVKPDLSGLDFCTYLGGRCNQAITNVALDASGNVYVAGMTTSDQTSFPVTVGPSLTYGGGGIPGDGFVAKLTPDGTALVYCGYVGGEGGDEVYGMAVDSAGRLYVAGTTSSKTQFPLVVGPALTSIDQGTLEGFVARVKADGSGFEYSGLVAGGGADIVTAVAVDASGSAYVTGITDSKSGLPVAVGPSLVPADASTDAFVGKIRPDGTGFAYLGYIAGAGDDTGDAVAVDTSGNAYVAGATRSSETTFPVRVGPDLTFNGDASGSHTDVYVAKVKPDGSGLVYCGYVGGDRGEGASRILVDSRGRAIVTGTTYSSEATFPVDGGPGLTFSGTSDHSDGFLAVVKANGSGIDVAGYLGGENDDVPLGLALDAGGNVIVVGLTTSTDFPVVGDFGPTHHGVVDGFVARVAIGPAGPPPPSIASVAKQGKKLVVMGANFAQGAKVVVNGTAYKAKADAAHPSEVLRSAKAGKAIREGDTVTVRNPDGAESNAVTYAP